LDVKMAKSEIEFFVSIRTYQEIEKLRMEIKKEYDSPTTPADRKSELK